MDVKPGYKQTEVGVIPEQWSVSTVGREFDVKLGKMLDAEKNVGVLKPYLGNRAVQWDRIDISDLPTVRMTRPDIERYRLRKGDVLACEGGEVGRAAIWDAPIEECYYQKALHRLRPLRGFDPRLMVGFLRHWSDRGVLSNYVTQTSIAHLPREKFLEVPLPVPPLAEQRAIAEALSDVDGLLGGLDRLIAKKRDLKQAAMQQLLTGQTRLPGFCGEWESKRLGQCLLSRPDYGINAPAVPYSEKLPCYVRITDISEHGRYRPDPRVSVAAAGAAEYHLRNGELVFARTGASVGKSYLYDPRDGELVFAGFLIRVRPDPAQLVPSYLAAIATTKAYWDWVQLMSMRSGQPGVNGNEYAQMPLFLPPMSEQTAIAEVLTDMDAELSALGQRRDKTRALKQAMMQELLTGRTRLV